MVKWILLLLPFLLAHCAALAQTDTTATDMFDLSLDQLMNMEVVSATGNKQKQNDAPAIIYVISQEQIRQYGYQTVADAINSLPGIDAHYDLLQYNAGVRGINSGKRAWSSVFKVLINSQSVSFRSNNENWLDGSLIPMEVIDHIEVIQGPASALYGANAFLGVINIITKKGADLDGAILAGSVNVIQNNPGGQFQAVGGKSYKGLDFLAAASYGYFNRSGLGVVEVPGRNYYPDSLTQNDYSKPLSIYTRLGYTKDKFGSLSADFHYQQMNSAALFQDWAPLNEGNRIQLQNMYARLQYEKTFKEKVPVSASVTYARGNPLSSERLSLRQVGIADYVTRQYGFRSVDAALSVGYIIKGNSRVTLGGDLSRDNHTPQTYYYHKGNLPPIPAGGIVFNDTIFQNVGIYAQALIYPFELLKMNNSLKTLGVTANIRYDVHNIYRNVLNYRVSLVYKPIEKIFVKALFGTSFRAPAATQLYTNPIDPTGDVIGNPALQPEQALTAELAVGGQISDWLSIKANGYYQDVENKQFIVRSANTIYDQAQNIASIKGFGGGLELNANHKYLNAYANYSMQMMKLNESAIDESENVPLFPQHQVKFGLMGKLPKFFLMGGVEGRYIGSRVCSEQNIRAYDPIDYEHYSLPAYFLLDLKVSTLNLKYFGEKESFIEFKISNLMNTAYAFPGYRNFDLPGLGRQFTIRFIQHF